ncbi:MAG: HAD-IC family P-type ATPase [Methanobacteriaceae archaeon]|nr:HAD-IC family P-type ATPase [Methanobacteriaceae archaeon]
MSDSNNGNTHIGVKEEAWYALTTEEVAQRLKVVVGEGLSSTEAAQRLKIYGVNVLEEEKEKPAWRKWLEQYKAYMQIVLVIAAIVSLFIAEYRTFLLLLVLTIFIANLGYRQEAKASQSVAALNKMMKVVAKVRRDNLVTQVEAEEIVPGDIVILDAGDRVPADGRVISAANLQVEESALTGESMAVEKNSAVIKQKSPPLGDQVNMAFMNTNVTRGHGEILVTETGMNTQVGNIATMLKEHKEEKTPLTQQIDRVTLFIIGMAVLAFLTIVIIGLSQGGSFKNLFNIGISLAIGSIPDALPAVVTSILAMGMMAMAKKNAIIKNMPAVETLGSTSAINSDKTGTLTMNQMTVKVISTVKHRYTVSGEGYSFQGKIQRIEGDEKENLDKVLFPCALCIDTDIQDGKVVGDPTEAALYVLAEKGGLNVQEFRKNNPRIASIPFDSDYKFMATFHSMKNSTGEPVVRAYIKGAPDVILERSAYGLMPDGTAKKLSADDKGKVLDENERIAREGLRVLALAEKDFDAESFDPDSDLMTLMENLIITALIGEVDPPRPEAKEAIRKAKEAGVRVRMITGDHAVTAQAIGRELGIEGKAVTGSEFASMSDEEAEKEIDDIGVLARVAPEHKVRLVKVLKKKGNIVAMTGDGVNDAPSIKAADIGIAMGITGTDVAKGAAKMILVDDNFATIVTAIEEGRKIYDNLQKFLRIQIANMFMFIIAFLGASIFSVVGTALYTPGQVLWIHMLVVAPIGIMFGMDMASPGIMTRKPRKHDEGIISKGMYIRLFMAGVYMALTSLMVYHIGRVSYGSVEAGQSMGLVCLSLMNIFLALNLRFPWDTAFQSATFSNIRLLYAYLWIIFGAILITETRLFNELFGTVPLDAYQWGLCLIPGILLLIIGEIYKGILRYRRSPSSFTPE